MRSTLSVPGTGLSYAKDSSNSERKENHKNVMGEKVEEVSSRKPNKGRTWLWVLGWICIFPLPLTILLLRKNKMKASVKYGIIGVAWLIYLIIAVAYPSDSDSESAKEGARIVTDLDDTNLDEAVQRSFATEPIEVNSISLQGPKEELILGECFGLKAIIDPDNADEKTLVWNTSDENVVTVNQEGKIIATGSGQAIITVSSSNGVSSTCEVNVDGTQRAMKLRVSHSREDDNNIGDEWSYITQINGVNTTSDYILTVGDKLEFYSKITESDKKPDIGEATASYIITEEDILKGLTVSMDVYVKENAGPNVGKSAHFVVTYNFEIQ